MKKTHLLAILLAVSPIHTTLHAQTISLLEDSQLHPITQEQTQTDIKPGWKIVDIQLKSHLQRYLWGQHAESYTDESRPQFVVDTDTLLLSNLVLIKLTTHSQYRKIAKPQVYENHLTFVDLNNFYITAYGEESFLIRPLRDLAPGEYLFTFFNSPTVGDLNDWYVWPFTVK